MSVFDKSPFLSSVAATVFLLAQIMAHGPSCGWCLTTTSTALCSTTWTATPSILKEWSNWHCQLPAASLICTWRFLEHKVILCERVLVSERTPLKPYEQWSSGLIDWPVICFKHQIQQCHSVLSMLLQVKGINSSSNVRCGRDSPVLQITLNCLCSKIQL